MMIHVDSVDAPFCVVASRPSWNSNRSSSQVVFAGLADLWPKRGWP